MLKLDKDDLLDLITLFSKERLNELNLRVGDMSLELKKNIDDNTFEVIKDSSITEKEIVESESKYYQVRSPMMGVFYESPSPDEKPYVSIGDKVNEGDTLFIVEAMKVIHEIASPITGRIKEIHSVDKDIVEYEQIVMEIEEC